MKSLLVRVAPFSRFADLFLLSLPLAEIEPVKAQPIEPSSPLGETGTLFGTGVKGLSDWTGDGIGEFVDFLFECGPKLDQGHTRSRK